MTIPLKSSLALAALSLALGARIAPAQTSASSDSAAVILRQAPLPLLNIQGKQDFAAPDQLTDDAATSLKGLCSLAEFRALPLADRHVYAFDSWPDEESNLGAPPATFNFLVGPGSVEKVTFVPSGGGPSSKANLARVQEADGQYSLQGLGNLDWSGIAEHRFSFDKPVLAFGVVLKSPADMDLRRFFWPAAVERNGYPVSYTLSDGSVVNLGQREVSGAILKAGGENFLSVIDRSGRGIVAVTYTLKGLAGNKAQRLAMTNWAFVTMPRPAVAPVINLRSSCDFYAPQDIVPRPPDAMPGLASLDDFRFIVGNHRYVYHCDTWPQGAAVGKGALEFPFDLKGKGAIGQKVSIAARVNGKDSRLVQASLTDELKLPYHVLGGLPDLSKRTSAEQTFKFTRPVWAFGVTYRSADGVELVSDTDAPVSYTLADGTVVKLGAKGVAGGTLAANAKTFVGVVDKTDKGIASVTISLRGRGQSAQPVCVEDMAFALAGPPPGDWKMTLDDNFDGNALNPDHWAPGYTFPDVINNEMQGYVPENVVVADGMATIKVEQRDCVNTDRTGRKGGAQKFASGAFTSYDKFTQTYGYFEARLKMPHTRGAGIWPAFWMLPDRGRAYGSGRGSYMTADIGRGMEIDMFEFMPWWKQLDGTFPVHVGCIWSYGPVTPKDPAPHGYGGYGLSNDGWGPSEQNFPHLDDEFHTYGIYWSPERLIYYVDSKPVFRVKDAAHIPDVPFYFLFNIAMSGNGWGKSPDKKHPTMEQIKEDLPNAMQIDYFRAYSGTLEEAVPAPPSDIPGPVTKYSPRKEVPVAVAAPAPAPAAPPSDVPAPPANVGITTPATG